MSDTDGFYDATAPAILVHPALLEPRAFGTKAKPKGDPKYGAGFVFEANDPQIATMKGVAAAVAKARWPGRNLKELAFPFKSGTVAADKRAEKCKAAGKEPDGEFSRGKYIITARSKFQPELSYVEGKQIIVLTDPTAITKAKPKFYFGVQALFQFKFVAYEAVDDRDPDGVNVYLQKVCSLNRGEKIGNAGASAAETFKGYVGSLSAEDPTGGGLGDGLDDEIPF